MSQDRPGGVTLVCVVAIVLGALGILTGVFGTIGLALQDTINQLQTTGMDPAQQKMQERIMEVQAGWHPFMWVANPANAFVSIFMLIGGIRALKPNDEARRFLFAVFLPCLAVDLLNGALGMAIQIETYPVMIESMKEMTRNEPGGAMASSIMQSSVMIGLIWGGGLILAKIAAYVFALVTLKRKETTAWYAPGPADAGAPAEA